MIKHPLLIQLLRARLLKQLAFLGPILPEATSDKPQWILDVYKNAVQDEVDFLRIVLEEKNL